MHAASRVIMREMAFTAQPVSADRAEILGIVNYVVEKEDRVEEAFHLAQGDARALLDLRADFIAGDPSLVERASAQGTDMAVWTVDDPQDAEKLRAWGIHRITTNEVERLLEWKRGG